MGEGKLFVLEGPDGVGKTTLSIKVTEALNTNGIDSVYFSFPGKDEGTLGEIVYTLHHNSSSMGIKTINPISLQILHIASHIDAIQSKILPALNNGQNVILDRFWWSTWVYGMVENVDRKSLDYMVKLELIHWENIKPYAVFLVHRNKVNNDEYDKAHRRNLIDQYSRLAYRESKKYKVLHFHNDKSVDESIKEILGHIGVKKKLKTSNKYSKLSRDKTSSNYGQAKLQFSLNHSFTTVPMVFSKLSPAKPTAVYDTYWRFAAERQNIFFKRLTGLPLPWTNDHILQHYKFTNVYRASDRVSQYLIKHVIYQGDQSPNEIFFRTILFKFFNKIETWEILVNNLKTISYNEYSFEHYDNLLKKAIEEGKQLYSAAYIMPSGGKLNIYGKKYRMHLMLLEKMMQDELPSRIADAKSMAKAFDLLKSYPSIGDFLAFQYAIDLNYSTITNFDEMEFVVAGPGARDGIRKCFSDLGGLNVNEIIKVIADRQQIEFERIGIEFKSLWGRPLQLIDCQNLFCEVDKYARVKHPDITGISDRQRIKQRYKINPRPIDYWFPPKWGLNDRIQTTENR